MFVIRADLIRCHVFVTEIDQQRLGFFHLPETNSLAVISQIPAKERIEGGQCPEMTIDVDVFDPLIRIDRLDTNEGEKEFIARFAMLKEKIDHRLTEFIGIRRKTLNESREFFTRFEDQIGRVKNRNG